MKLSHRPPSSTACCRERKRKRYLRENLLEMIPSQPKLESRHYRFRRRGLTTLVVSLVVCALFSDPASRLSRRMKIQRDTTNPSMSVSSFVFTAHSRSRYRYGSERKQKLQQHLPFMSKCSHSTSICASTTEPESNFISYTDTSSQEEVEMQDQQQIQIRLKDVLEDAASRYTRTNCAILGTKSIGVDYGCKRTGVAITVGYNPKPVDIIVVDVTEKVEGDKEGGSNGSRLQKLDSDFLTISSEISIEHMARQFPLEDDKDDDDRILTESQQQDRHERRLLLLHSHQRQVAQQVIEICKREGDVQRFVVGLPLHKNGTVAEQSMISRLFAVELAKQSLQTFGPGASSSTSSSSTATLPSASTPISGPISPKVEVWLWDERYSSKEAAARVHSINPNQGLYGLLDADSACIILEHFYNDHIQRRGQGHKRVMVDEHDSDDDGGGDAVEVGGGSGDDDDDDDDVTVRLTTVNGELVSVNDPILIQKCMDEWNEKQRQKLAARQKSLDDRDARLLMRKKIIEEDMKREEQALLEQQGNTKKKKKKKKK